MTYIGIDNGATGTIAILDGDTSVFVETPTTYMLNYQKSKVRHINRIDAPALKKLLESYNPLSTRVIIERPMINNFRFQASIAAARSLEATLIVLESLHFGYEYVDSGAWQKVLLPAGVKGAPKLKKASKDVGLRMFPMHEETIKKHGDADALLIAEWARRRGV